MSNKSITKVIKKLERIKNSLNNEVNWNFINMSLDWILNRANKILDTRTNHIWGSEARLWTKKIYSTYGILENQDMNSGAIEFGIGVIGEVNPHPIAQQENYEYNMPSEHKDNYGRWTFQDARTGQWVINFSGYKGKSFLYDATMEYYTQKVWLKLYQKAFDKAMKGICK